MSDTPKRRRCGRPTLDPAGQPSTLIGVRLTAADFDKVWAVARQRRESMQDVIRRVLKRELEHPSR